MKEYPANMPWAIVQLKNQAYAIAVQDLREMVRMPEVAQIANTPDYVRGVINLRGQALTLVDLRVRLGMTSSLTETDEFCKLMEQRAQDHRSWVDELQHSVTQHQEFKLTTDPHQCAFGKWYDSYRASDPWIAALLRKFDDPHTKIHKLGTTVRQLMAENEWDKANRLIAEERAQTLSRMLALFADLRALVLETRREMAVVLMNAGRTFAVSVDSAQSIEKLSIENMPSGAQVGNHGVVRRLGKSAKDNRLVPVIETDRLLGETARLT